MSASLLEDDDEEEVAAAMLQGQNETSAYGRILADLSSTEPMAVGVRLPLSKLRMPIMHSVKCPREA